MRKVPVVWTREKQVEDEDLCSEGESVIELPLLSYVTVPVKLPSFAPQFLIVTSKKALEFSLVEPKLREKLSKLAILTFGEATYLAVKKKRLSGHTYRSSNG